MVVVQTVLAPGLRARRIRRAIEVGTVSRMVAVVVGAVRTNRLVTLDLAAAWSGDSPVRVCRARITRVAGPVPVEILLPGVRHTGAVVTCITDVIPIAVGLNRVGDERAVVGGIRHAVAVIIPVTGVARGIGIVIRLGGIGDSGAVVAGGADAIAVGVPLLGVGQRRAVVHRATTPSASRSSSTKR